MKTVLPKQLNGVSGLIPGSRPVHEVAVADDEADLDELLSRLTPDNVHDEVNFGAPVGNEAL